MQTGLERRDVTPSRIGLGAAQFGNLFEATSDEESAAAVAAAWSLGLRYFDTAPHYGLGLSERRLGRALAAFPRDEWLISSKVGRLLVPTPERAADLDDDGFIVPATHRRVFDFSRDGIWRSVEESLQRLATDHLDIAYLHDPDEDWETASTSGVAALVELRDQGIVRAIGAGMNQSAMLTRFVETCDLDVVMVAGRLTLLDQTATSDLLPAASEHGVGVIAAGVYNSGILSAPVVSSDASFHYGAAPAAVLDRARSIARVCEAYGVTLPEVAVQFPFRFPPVVSVVLGIRSAEHIQGGVARSSVAIPEQLWDELEQSGLVVTVG